MNIFGQTFRPEVYRWLKKLQALKDFSLYSQHIRFDIYKVTGVNEQYGHEPLDTDTTPNLEGEYWLLHNHFCQAEGVTNLDKVPEAGALISIGFAKPEGGSGGYARYIAICPPDWKYGVSVLESPGAPLPKQPYPLRRDKNGVLKPTKQ
jgi:hypothetical protein